MPTLYAYDCTGGPMQPCSIIKALDTPAGVKYMLKFDGALMIHLAADIFIEPDDHAQLCYGCGQPVARCTGETRHCAAEFVE